MDHEKKTVVGSDSGKQKPPYGAIISGFRNLFCRPLALRIWRASLFLEPQGKRKMAKKGVTKQPEVARVWDDELEDQIAQPSEDDGETGTEADMTALDGPTDDELVEDGEIIDGTEDDITDLEQQDEEPDAVASDVGGDEDSPVTAAVKAAVAVAKRKKEVSMADKMTKADHIRAEIEKRKKSGDSMRPRDIIEALSKKGVEVTAPQVSVMVKKETGGKATAKAERPEKVRAASAVKKPIPTKVPEKKAAAATKATKPTGVEKQQFDLLFDAAAFVEKCGGVESAINALTAYERLTALRG